MKSKIKLIATLTILSGAFRMNLVAGDAAMDESAYGGGVPPRAEAVFITHAPVIDGVWSEGEWSAAKPAFFPVAANDGDGHAVCEVRFLWTKEGVYVGFRTTDTNPVFGHAKAGESLYQEDAFELFIDQTGDHRQFYEVQADPAGQLYFRNNILTAPPRITPKKRLAPEFCSSELWRYDIPKPDGFQIASKLDSRTHVWTLEMFLPVSFINRRRGRVPMEPCAWRLNLARYDWDLPRDDPKRKVTFMYWSPVLPGHPHLSPTAMGSLEFMQP